MNKDEETVREMLERVASPHLHSLIHICVHEDLLALAAELGIIDTPKKSVPWSIQAKFCAGIIFTFLKAIGQTPHGQMLILMILSVMFLPVYWMIVRG